MNRQINKLMLAALLLLSGMALAQPGSKNFGKVWLQGQSLIYSTTFNGTAAPDNQLITQSVPLYLTAGHSGICDSSGNPILASDGFNIYDKNLNIIDSGGRLVPERYLNLYGFSRAYQSSIILPFDNGIYRLITPTVSDDSCYYNWEHAGSGALFDLLLYDEVDMNANGGAGKVTKRMVPLLQNVRLSKTQMMACRHGDGKSWWLLKQASDTNLIYKFLLTEDKVYGPCVQGFSGAAARFGYWDLCGQAMFSKDGTKYATTIHGYGKVFIADFDRCTGMLSNPKVYKVPAQLSGNPSDSTEKDSSTCGLSFSPSGRYLYVSGFNNVHQLDLQNATSPMAWTHLSGMDTTWWEFQEYSNIYPGQNGKLYIGNWSGLGGQMSVIDSPDNKGAAAGFCRKCLRFPGYNRQGIIRYFCVGNPPCMPNYSLGSSNPICYPAGVGSPTIEEAAFTLYPNPSRGLIEVQSSEAGTLLLYDMTGRVMCLTILGKAGNGPVPDAGLFTPGVYQYKFISKSGQSKAGKLVITP